MNNLFIYLPKPQPLVLRKAVSSSKSLGLFLRKGNDAPITREKGISKDWWRKVGAPAAAKKQRAKEAEAKVQFGPKPKLGKFPYKGTTIGEAAAIEAMRKLPEKKPQPTVEAIREKKSRLKPWDPSKITMGPTWTELRRRAKSKPKRSIAAGPKKEQQRLWIRPQKGQPKKTSGLVDPFTKKTPKPPLRSPKKSKPGIVTPKW